MSDTDTVDKDVVVCDLYSMIDNPAQTCELQTVISHSFIACCIHNYMCIKAVPVRLLSIVTSFFLVVLQSSLFSWQVVVNAKG